LGDSIVKVTTVPQIDEDGNIFRFLEIVENITDRKLSEATLRESEERYRKLVEFSPIGIAIQSDYKIMRLFNFFWFHSFNDQDLQ
jgi:PAS domain-containing protein